MPLACGELLGTASCLVRRYPGNSLIAKPVSADAIEPTTVKKSEPAYLENQLGLDASAGASVGAACDSPAHDMVKPL